ncbi:hypothetical protein [Neodiprion abietis nucleopolyhedrovirus]|uniref:Uncharacterized protein n=1 Tax=Neodiprion abietis nucleopolyhedrovirus TaxID=204507 RepID=Q0ZNZ6_9CBAC|nr:hypothetical protein [Neodiprion abietis nucleopolyhedrovirus]ABC74958.1 unknown [Neodiprion abietis nucleopolyhedrovirus]
MYVCIIIASSWNKIMTREYFMCLISTNQKSVTFDKFGCHVCWTRESNTFDKLKCHMSCIYDNLADETMSHLLNS